MKIDYQKLNTSNFKLIWTSDSLNLRESSYDTPKKAFEEKFLELTGQTIDEAHLGDHKTDNSKHGVTVEFPNFVITQVYGFGEEFCIYQIYRKENEN